jgi:fructoselysine 6-kinase
MNSLKQHPKHFSMISVGEITIDKYRELNRQFIGGISHNFAVNAKLCGVAGVALVSRIGRDDVSGVLPRLQAQGIDITRIRVQEGATACQEIIVTPSGERVFPNGGYHPGVLAGYTLDQDEIGFIQQHEVLFCPRFSQLEPLYHQVMRATEFGGARVVDFLDLADYQFDAEVILEDAQRLNIAFVSGNDALIERLRPWSRSSRCLVVVTLGAKGSVALLQGETKFQAAVPLARVVDTTGCGDAFAAAFTVSYLQSQDVATALFQGAQQAALAAQHLGAVA